MIAARRPDEEPGTPLLVQCIIAGAAIMLVLGLALQPEGGVACIRADLAGAPGRGISLGNVKLCGESSGRSIASSAHSCRTTSVTIGILGRVAYLKVTPDSGARATDGRLRATIGALRQNRDGELVPLFMLEKAFHPPVSRNVFWKGRPTGARSSRVDLISEKTWRAVEPPASHGSDRHPRTGW